MKKFLGKKSKELVKSEKDAKELLNETVGEIRERFILSPGWAQCEEVAFFESFKEFFKDFVIKERIREGTEYQTKVHLSNSEKYTKDKYLTYSPRLNHANPNC